MHVSYPPKAVGDDDCLEHNRVNTYVAGTFWKQSALFLLALSLAAHRLETKQMENLTWP
jgi:hypothetical protein